ncbi:MAG: ABC transporter ATP-binding protein [Gammaproteobacteria bacterium]|nr:ABC transporter ATP-binding protein [Gammaproteobacteria bacterium]
MTTSPTPALQIKGLKKTYANGVEALHGIDLEVQRGDFFALLGPNGAGKSTAIGIISSLVTFSEGSVTIFGHDVIRDYAVARACLGLVPQEFNFNQFDPVCETLMHQAGYYGIRRQDAEKRTQRLLEQFDLWDKRSVMARELSGGMKRRLMIARAMIHEPQLLILDEPTAGVDLEIRHNLWHYLKEINSRGTTIILTTHYLEEAEQLCRTIAIISNGRIRTNTTMRELLDQLDSEHFVLYLKNPLPHCPKIDGYALHCPDPRTLEATIHKGADLNRLFSELSAQGIDILSMKNKTNRLEKLFLQLVGHHFD